LAESARQIQGSTLGQRVQLENPDRELAILAENLNQMLYRLDKSFKAMQEFSQDIAHELRTPLTNLRVQTELALSKPRPVEEYREVLVSNLEEYEHLAGVIDRLWFLALAEGSEVCLVRKPVDVGEELASIANFYEAAASEMNLSIQLAANGDLCMSADPVLVRRAVSNLVSNAIAHTPPGGTIGLAAYKQQSSIRVVVTDSGEGIPAEHLPHVFDRFYRVGRASAGHRSGVGLGLSIVRTVMNLHKGLVEITSAPGRGTCVILEFPLLTKS
jgi:two-component system heavy metal sensor histidine kinase CusS